MFSCQAVEHSGCSMVSTARGVPCLGFKRKDQADIVTFAARGLSPLFKDLPKISASQEDLFTDLNVHALDVADY